MLSFWQDALHYVPRARMSVQDSFVILRDPKGQGPNLSLDKTLEGETLGSTKRPRLHLDLYAESQKDEVTRLLGIGASRHQQTYDPEDDFIVLEDPDGNLFCVVQT